jgi:hypothetical protein
VSEPKDPYAAFRVNFEQQQKRAKELLGAVQAGDAAALQRLRVAGFTEQPKLAHAQHCLARELRFANWAALKHHCDAMDSARASPGSDLDNDCRTMHVRCGSDFLHELRAAGFHGDFVLHINPYHEGPVVDAPDWLERRARYISDRLGPYMPELTYQRVLEETRLEEARLGDGARNYERVALWLEHDRYDQFVLLRCLAYFAEHGAPLHLELITANDFPGSERFVGLGQLPAEALSLLWAQRKPINAEQLAFAHHVWNLFRAPDPRPLAELVHKGTPLLPDLAGALHRHLQELPSPHNGLGLTQQLLLQILADRGRRTAGSIVGTAMRRDPLPGLGDLGYEQTLRDMENLSEPLVLRSGGHAVKEWFRDEVELSELGRAVLAGRVNWLDLPVPERWLGGVQIATRHNHWRWHEVTRSVDKT